MTNWHKLKALKEGSNKEADLNYLKELSIQDLFIKTPEERALLLPKWNELHKPPLGKVRNFTFVRQYPCPRLIDRVKEVAPKYAYILHNKDKDAHKHLHFYIEFPNPRSFSSVANDLDLPVTCLQKVLNKRAIIQYLTHENDPKKYHYDKHDIATNMDLVTEVEDTPIDPLQLYDDYAAMREGRMARKDFIQRYRIYIVRHSFSSMLQITERVYNAYDGNDSPPFSPSGNGGTCPPFRVPSSRASPSSLLSKKPGTKTIKNKE